MIINPQLAADVRQALINDQEHPYRGRDKRSYPDEKCLAEILDAAFRASLMNEEGRPVRGSLTWLSEDELQTLEIPKRRESPLIIRLSEPRSLDGEIVAKLATATGSGSSSLLISWFGVVPKIWGFIYSQVRQTLLSEIPAGIPEVRHFQPDVPTIEITGAGSLVITRAGSVIGRIERGEFRAAAPTPFNPLAMGPILYGLFDIKISGQSFATEEDGYKYEAFIACLEYLLLQIDRRGGGATVIFVPEASIPLAKANAKFPWECEDELELGKLIHARIRYKREARNSFNSVISVLKTDEALRYRLNNIARLASLDGAVLLTSNFEVMGFGAKLHSDVFSGSGKVSVGLDGIGGGGGFMDFTSYGTRHNSALNFVASVPGAVAFIASTDGPIRGLAKSANGAINCWPDCRLSMFV
jgi:Probable sensor domain DACNV